MFGQLGLKIKIFGGLIAAFIVYSLYDADNLNNNYTVVQASITKVTVDCYIKGRRRKIVDPETNKLAYMDCKIAPLVAAKHKFSDFRIRKRAIIQYRYRSPVDKRMYDGSFNRYGKEIDDAFAPGKNVQVRAHKTQPAESRVSSNLFVDDNDV